MTRRAPTAAIATAVAAILFALWTFLALRTDAFGALDSASTTPGVDPTSDWGQILAAVSIVTAPAVVFVALATMTVWAARRRLRNLAWALGTSVVLAWAAIESVKPTFRRPRPGTAIPIMTADGWSYPSSHLTAATVLAVLAVATIVVMRGRRSSLYAGIGLAAAYWVVIAHNRWALRAHWFSDLIGGTLLGLTVAAASLALAGVHVVRLPPSERAASAGSPRAAAIVNPTKISGWHVFRQQVEGEFASRGWAPPLWLETTADEPGATAARAARRHRVDLVIVAGGDGTVREVCSGLSGTHIPIAILPVGTGNLLARNLGIPLDLSDALDVAFEGRPRPLDLVTVRADGGRERLSVVMAGMGFDAIIMGETRSDLKRAVGSTAYVMAALQAVGRPPFAATVTLDHAEPVRRQPAMVLVANVGLLQGNIALAPDARPDDGLLDVLVASPRSAADWAVLTSRLLTRSQDAPGLERAQARHVVFETAEPVAYQIDGDNAGICRRLEASIRPGLVTVIVPG